MKEQGKLKKLVYINENYKLLKDSHNIVEGGLARNIALMNWLQATIPGLKEVRLSQSALLNIFIVLFKLLFARGKTIFFQYVTVGLPLFNPTPAGRMISQLFLKVVNFASKGNEIIFDVSDLKYEQARDLQLSPDRLDRIEAFEARFFKLKVKFIFASFAMRAYACEKYLLAYEKTEVLINGGYVAGTNSSVAIGETEASDKTAAISKTRTAHKTRERDKIVAAKKAREEQKQLIRFVYAGTLNPGRNIKKMLDSFPLDSEKHLYLMGNQGDWILEEYSHRNITYLGALAEEEAHQIVSTCDLGLIPYDNSLSYFNLAYPTKLSFYLTAGIPVLTTPTQEILRVKEDYHIGFVLELDSWPDFFSSVKQQEIEKIKGDVLSFREQFTWDNIFAESEFLGKYKEDAFPRRAGQE